MHIPLCSQTITFRDETDCILIKMCLQLLGCVLLMYVESIFSKAEVIHIVENCKEVRQTLESNAEKVIFSNDFFNALIHNFNSDVY